MSDVIDCANVCQSLNKPTPNPSEREGKRKKLYMSGRRHCPCSPAQVLGVHTQRLATTNSPTTPSPPPFSLLLFLASTGFSASSVFSLWRTRSIKAGQQKSGRHTSPPPIYNCFYQRYSIKSQSSSSHELKRSAKASRNISAMILHLFFGIL